jgi:hypothetical protein
MLPRHETPTRLVDEHHDCQDIGSAYVPGTVWGTASSLTAKFRSALCLPLDTGKLSTGKPARAPYASNLVKPTSLRTVRRLAPDKRGFGQPSTLLR